MAEMPMVCSLWLQTDFRCGKARLPVWEGPPSPVLTGLAGPGLSVLCGRGWLWLLHPVQLALNLETFSWRLSRRYR